MNKFLLIATLALCVCAGSVSAAEKNLVPNGTFDSFDQKTGRAAHWNKSVYLQVVEEGIGTTPVLRMCAYYRSRTKQWKCNTFTVIPEIPAGEYRFSLKTKGAANEIYMFLTRPKGQKGSNYIRGLRKLQMKSIAGTWKQGEYVFTVKEAMKNARLTLEVFYADKGEYEYLDDVKLVKIK